MGIISFPLPRPPRPGDKFYLEGKIEDDAPKFTVSLVSDLTDDGKILNIPFYYIADLNEKRATLCSKFGEKWNEHEKVGFLDPLIKGKKFFISLNVLDEGFKLYAKNDWGELISTSTLPNPREIMDACDYNWSFNIWDGLASIKRGVYDAPDYVFSKKYQ